MSDEQQKQEKKKSKALKYGCGCLIALVVVFAGLAILGMITEANMTPEEKAARDEQRKQDNIEKEQAAARVQVENAKKAAEKNEKQQKEAQFKKAESLKGDAFVFAKQCVLASLKSPSTAKFQPASDASVLWWKDNIFLSMITVDAQNGFGAMLRNTVMCEVEYLGDKKWRLLDMGEPEKIMAKKSKPLVDAATADQEREYNQVIERIKKKDTEEKKKNEEERFAKWKATYLLEMPTDKKLKTLRYYRVPNEITLYSEGKCENKRESIEAGALVEVVLSEGSGIYHVKIYAPLQEKIPSAPIGAGWIKAEEMKLP